VEGGVERSCAVARGTDINSEPEAMLVVRHGRGKNAIAGYSTRRHEARQASGPQIKAW
jgi:hypothetical protein